MDIRQLKYFVEVAKQKSFTRASTTLLVSQPSISKMIKSLEEELGVVLLDRNERKVVLTDAGAMVFEQAQTILQMMEQLTLSVDELVHMKRGRVKMGLMPTVGSLLFPHTIARFRKEYPDIEMQMVEHKAKQLQHQVEQGELDVAVTVHPVDEALFETVPLLSEELVAIADNEHWLVERESVRLAELKNESFILFSEEFVLHDVVRQACAQAGFEPKVAYVSQLWDLVGEMVATQLGIALVPRSMVRRLNQRSIQAVTISEPHIDWKLVLIYRRDRYLSYAARAFIRYAEANWSIRDQL
ncbi:LysR family transcriptional regulator [Brevibacillus fluminis]|uniref:LysR family transcriptional regulator n=1 Tax=Brevibacillus fluminis TaxID=511487 RepID=A0A3M8DYV3_9BACL|nr:LysR family transcriptional regulator [Brevibacillus fluminis]RNB92411.1 LysR family transcriptional regulator [Brevibacillus fluminis]